MCTYFLSVAVESQGLSARKHPEGLSHQLHLVTQRRIACAHENNFSLHSTSNWAVWGTIRQMLSKEIKFLTCSCPKGSFLFYILQTNCYRSSFLLIFNRTQNETGQCQHGKTYVKERVKAKRIFVKGLFLLSF